ncbi:MAG: B12-binding domain-containing radical SAM protein [Candidatus Hermodarchaeota archaeon]
MTQSILIYPQLEFANVQIPTPPYSILFIADYLMKRNIGVEIFDLRFDEISSVLDGISNNDPEFVGISAMTGPQIHYALKISEIIKKEYDKIKIVWGGVHSTILPTQTLQNAFVDYVVRGEGEKPYYELISGKELHQIKGLSFKKEKKIYHNPNSDMLTRSELNQLSIPWNLINPKRYVRNGSFNAITSRGCPFKCAFCYNTLFNNVWRGWTAEKCAQELNKCLDFGVKKITFYDDYFFANSKRIKDLFIYFKEQEIKWKAELRVNRLDYSLAKEAKSSGCTQLYFGAESGSQRVLEILNKNITPKDIIQSAKITRDNDLSADYSWMIGTPGETKSDIKKTLTLVKRIKEINPKIEFSIKILFPYPGTEVYNLAKQEGFNPPSNLMEWAKIRRDRASDYLNHRNQLETISLTSAIIGKSVFQQENIAIFKLLRILADFRWNHQFFGFGFENFYFNIFRELIDKVMSKRKSVEYDPFANEFVSIKDNKKI